jgi:uncharacterized protein
MTSHPAAATWSRRLQPPERTFFLFGPRGVGKSTWLKHHFASAITLDLLRSDLFLDLTRHPETLEARIGRAAKGAWVCLDEVQRVPTLLNEVHRLIEDRKLRFALSGSSARKLKRGGANLLGGRALTLRMAPPVSAELRDQFDLEQTLLWGSLPLVVQSRDQASALLRSYVHTYLREEILEEGLIRKLDSFSRFLEIAGLVNGQVCNLGNIAREAAVPRASVDVYFSILEDTLLGQWLTPYRPGARIRELGHPKFYWFDAGVARAAAGLSDEPVDNAWKGFSLETMLLHEMQVFNESSEKHRPIHYWRTGAGVEVDFVVETSRKTTSKKAEVVLIEAKLAKKWDRRWESGARALASSNTVICKRMIGVYTGRETLTFDGFDVLPVAEFLRLLHAGSVF